MEGNRVKGLLWTTDTDILLVHIAKPIFWIIALTLLFLFVLAYSLFSVSNSPNSFTLLSTIQHCIGE